MSPANPMSGPDSGGWHDVTYPVSADMPVWPGQPPVEIRRIASMGEPGDCNESVVQMSAHTGTHMDAPVHFIAGDDDITSAPLAVMTGTVRVARVTTPGMIDAADLAAYEDRTGPLVPGERLLFRTRNSDRDWTREPFDKGYAAVAADLARALVVRQVALVGVDYLSVAPFTDTVTTHRVLLHARVWVIKGLDLRRIDEGRYEMIAAPLKLVTSDASPLRVLLRPLSPPTT